jgi:hypothetical protein
LIVVPPPTVGRQDRDGTVPRRGQTVVEVEPVVRRELVGRHPWLEDERSGFQDDHRSASPRELHGDEYATGSRADHTDIGFDSDEDVGDHRSTRLERDERRRLVGERLDRRPIPDRRPERVRWHGLARSA